jgi:alkanesulfonate monooxygenase SsuD/methylene tetrahydromethanopterin reductase-like flavin-dependent oxidoreductase (luciferase family)
MTAIHYLDFDLWIEPVDPDLCVEEKMHPIQFGYSLPIFAYPGARLFRTPNYAQLDPRRTIGLGKLADQLGYDSLWVADHLMLGKENAIMEGWTTLAALAGATERARLGMIHQGHFFRHPALHAKMTATLDQISGGRFIYFIDAGYGKAEHLAYGLPYPETMEDRLAELFDGLQITLALWQADQPVSLKTQFFEVTEATATPCPLQSPHPPVWFGEAHPMILAATARYAQGWNTVPVGLAEVARRIDALNAACVAVGRDAAGIEKSLETQILLVPEGSLVRQRLQAMIDLAPSSEPLDGELQAFLNGERDELPEKLAAQWLVGTPDQVEAQLRAYIDLGVTHFMLWFMDAPDEEGMRLFANEVMPRFR